MSSTAEHPAAPHPPVAVVVGASAGGIEALRAVAERLPPDLPAAVLVVVHSAPDSPRLLSDILQASGPLPASYAEHGEDMAPARIYVASPDHHLLLEGTKLRVVRGAKENRARPAIDPLFRSAAASLGARVIGVVLSGMMNDGTGGLAAIKRCGGVAVVQDPADARYGDMPLHALSHVSIDHRLPAHRIGELLGRLTRELLVANPLPLPPAEQLSLEAEMVQMRRYDMRAVNRIGKLSAYACPTCNGSLRAIRNDVLRFRCDTGHAFTAENPVGGQDDGVERGCTRPFAPSRNSASWPPPSPGGCAPTNASSSPPRYEAEEAQHDAEAIRTLLQRAGRRPAP